MPERKIEIDKKCPICGEIIKSDANAHEFCKLCGMGIFDLELTPKYRANSGEIYYFCCDHCLALYKFEIDEES